MRVLLSGFEPFGGDAENASGAVVAALAESWSDPQVDLVTVVLPVRFDAGPALLASAIARLEPDVVLCLGEAGGRGEITPERWAGPLAEARIPDNAGQQPHAEPLDDNPGRLATGLDADAMAAAIRAAGVPAVPSEDAGTFVCNAVFRAALRDFDGPAGFVHVPAVRRAGTPAGVGAETDAGVDGIELGLSLDDLAEGIGAAVRSCGAPR